MYFVANVTQPRSQAFARVEQPQPAIYSNTNTQEKNGETRREERGGGYDRWKAADRGF